MARPTEYNEEMVTKAKEYLLSCEDYELEKGNPDRPVFQMKIKLPSIEGLSIYLGVARSTIYEWKEKYKEFSDILDEIMSEQAERLVNNGLSGSYNSTIAKLILTKHGYSDKIDSDLTSGGKPLPLLNAIFNNNSDAESSETI